MSDHLARFTVSFLRSLRIAVLTVVAVILFFLVLPNLLARVSAQPGPAVQLGGYLLLVAALVADAVLVARDRSWGRWRWPVLLTLLAAYLGFTLLLPPGAVFTIDNWFFSAIGWFGVLVLFDRPLVSVVAFVAGCLAVTAVPVVLLGPADRPALVGLGITAVSVGGFQVLTATAAGALRRIAGAAASDAATAERARTRREVARQVHLDRRRRYHEIADTARPLLAGLADGTLDPADETVVRRCAIEAARMRRLFAESDDIGDRLLNELRACVAVAERRGVLVNLIVQGGWPELPREVRRALTDAPMHVLSTAVGAARVTVVGSTEVDQRGNAVRTVAVSVLADQPGTPAVSGVEPTETSGVRTTSILDGTRVWVEATWRADRGSPGAVR